MTGLKPSMRPKLNGDTFIIPDSSGAVYFRNNIGSFRMEGRRSTGGSRSLSRCLTGRTAWTN
ncbi:hypothetical protein LJK88_49085 [Paenibacillus sp. P26]|nr:hypothetical protein LJK88_49085 [Paenibacillus sp. P26]